MIPQYLAYVILEKVKNHHEQPPTAKLICVEIAEYKLAEITYRYFITDLANQSLLKIVGENKDDWGDLYIMPNGEQFIKEYQPLGMYQRNEDLGQFLNLQMIKNTGELIQAKKSSQLHLDSQKRVLEQQKILFERGKPNVYDFQMREVSTAELTLRRIEDELEKRTTLNMPDAFTIGKPNNNSHKLNVPKKKLSPEEEWKKEAQRLGLNVGTTRYYNFIQNKKQEQKDKEDEEKRKKEYDYFVGENTVLCPNIDEFKQFLSIQELNPNKFEYMNLLHQEKIKYTQAKKYYDVWGGRGGLIDRHELYGKIIGLINIRIEHGINPTTPNEASVKTPKNDRAKIRDTSISSTEVSIDSIKNNFDSLPVIDVYNHFYNSFVKTKHLTEIELLAYLKCAFEELKPTSKLFKFHNPPTKQKVMKVFYEYYKNVASKPHGKQRKYAALLGNYFEGYSTDSVSTNFNK